MAVYRYSKRECDAPGRGCYASMKRASRLVRPESARFEDRAGVAHEHLVDLVLADPCLAEGGEDVVGDVVVVPLGARGPLGVCAGGGTG
jgi:hypothetical protein